MDSKIAHEKISYRGGGGRYITDGVLVEWFPVSFSNAVVPVELWLVLEITFHGVVIRVVITL